MVALKTTRFTLRVRGDFGGKQYFQKHFGFLTEIHTQPRDACQMLRATILN